MKYDDNDIVAQAKEQLAIFTVKPFKRVHARTLTIFQKYGIFDSVDPKVVHEDILPILESSEHPDRRDIGSGPLFCYLAEKNPPEAKIVNMLDLLFAPNIILRKAALDFLKCLEDETIPLLTSKSRGTLRAFGEALLSDDNQKWRDAAVAIYDVLDEDWYCNYAAFRQCLNRDFIPGIDNYLTKIIRPTIPSVDAVTLGIWEVSTQKEMILKKINKIAKENTNLFDALNKYFLLFGHIPLALDLSITSLIDKWEAKYGSHKNIWNALWKWADSYELPLPRYHVCLYFICNQSLVPSGSHKNLWHEIVEIISLSGNENSELKWTQSWKMLCEIARHYCCHLETQLPYMNGERIASQAWWLALQMCKAFTLQSPDIKHLREVTFIPELTNSSRIWQIASPCIRPSSLRLLTLNCQSIFALSLQSVLGENIENLNLQEIDKEDFEKIGNAVIGSVLAVYPPVLKKDSEKTYAYDGSVLPLAKKWADSLDTEDNKKVMLEAFVTGIEKLIKVEKISELLNKVSESHAGDQVLIANYLKNMIFTEEISLDEIWKAVDESNWREAAFTKSHTMVFELIFDALNEIEIRYQDKWAYNLPHFYALESDKCEDKERKEQLFACVILSSLSGSAVSGIQRLLKGENKHSYQDYVDHWRARLEGAYKWAPEWVKARIRPVLAVLHL